jgi:hypothetical protein
METKIFFFFTAQFEKEEKNKLFVVLLCFLSIVYIVETHAYIARTKLLFFQKTITSFKTAVRLFIVLLQIITECQLRAS